MNIIITGGHSGMGLELTKKLLTEGHKIGLIVRSESRKKETKNLFSSENTIDIFVADLSKRNEIEQVANQIQSSWDNIDGLLIMQDCYWYKSIFANKSIKTTFRKSRKSSCSQYCYWWIKQ